MKQDFDNPFAHLPKREPVKAPVLHTIDKTKIHFDDPAHLMILARIIDKSIENPSPEFSPEQIQQLDNFLRTAHSLGNDVTELALFFKQHMPTEFPIINTKGALVDVIFDTTKAAAADPSVSEISALAQLFRALAAICFAGGFIRAVESVAKELDVAATLWEDGAIQTSDILRVTDNLKNALQL